MIGGTLLKISIICVYNNLYQLEECLLKSLKTQNIDYELILIEGVPNKFASCSAALNYGVKKSSGDILIFSHQDIVLKRNDELEQFAEYIIKMPEGTIVGSAGAIETKKINVGNYTSGTKINNELVWNYLSPVQVACVDECFFGMKKSTYNRHKFDEELCDDWHLYAVEQCLFHRRQQGKVFVYPSQIHHLSQGKISRKYMNGLVKLVDEYKKDFKYIWTTCYKLRANYFYVRILRMLWILNRKIRNKDM